MDAKPVSTVEKPKEQEEVPVSSLGGSSSFQWQYLYQKFSLRRRSMKQILNEGQNNGSLKTDIQNHNVLTQSRQMADPSPFSRQKFLNEKQSSDKQRYKKNREGGTNQDDECSSQSLSNSSNKSMGPAQKENGQLKAP